MISVKLVRMSATNSLPHGEEGLQHLALARLAACSHDGVAALCAEPKMGVLAKVLFGVWFRSCPR